MTIYRVVPFFGYRTFTFDVWADAKQFADAKFGGACDIIAEEE